VPPADIPASLVAWLSEGGTTKAPTNAKQVTSKNMDNVQHNASKGLVNHQNLASNGYEYDQHD
jgi:hypothetical protein